MSLAVLNDSFGRKRSRVLRRVEYAAVPDTDLKRAVFNDGYKVELFVWTSRKRIRGFELHFAIHSPREWSMRWTVDEGITFWQIDSGGGEQNDGHAMIAVDRSESLPVHDLYAEFLVISRTVDEPIRQAVLRQLCRVIRSLTR